MAKLRTKKLSDYQFDDKNINQGSEFGDMLLEKSIRELGMGRSMLADRDGVMIAGNKTLAKAGELGIEKVVEIETDGTELVIVRRKDLSINSEAGVKMKILDNTVSKHNYVEDLEVVDAICEEYSIENPVALGLGEQVGKKKGPENPNDPFDDKGISPDNKFGVIVMCDTDEDQQSIYNRLTEEGFKCKIVVV